MADRQREVVLELFEQRLFIYDEITAIVGEVTKSGHASDELQYRYFNAIKRVPFFFDDEVNRYLEKLRLELINLDLANTMMKEMQAPDRHEWVAKRTVHFRNVT